jgi:hypothetical protein
MNGSKIQLSPAEERLVQNAEVILTKNRVMEKMKELLEGVQAHMLEATFSNAHAFTVPPKISRGENYLGLPYLVLDYPRLFTPDAVFAVRSFFWWGRFFSSTLQLSGRHKEEALPKLISAYATFSNHHIGVNADPWQHHFDSSNYRPVETLSHEDYRKVLHTQPHIKLATKLPVEEWQQAETFLFENWKLYLNVLNLTPGPSPAKL